MDPSVDQPIRTSGSRTIVRNLRETTSEKMNEKPVLPLIRPQSAPNLMQKMVKPLLSARKRAPANDSPKSATVGRASTPTGAQTSPRLERRETHPGPSALSVPHYVPSFPGSPRLVSPVLSPSRITAEDLPSGSPSFIGTVKADIICLQRKLDQLMGKKDSTLHVNRMMANYSASSDPLVDMQTRLRLIEIRDGQMMSLENFLSDKYDSSGGRKPWDAKDSAMPSMSRLHSYLRLVHLFLALANVRQKSGGGEGTVLELEEQLQEVRDKVGALEKQNEGLMQLQKILVNEHDTSEAERAALLEEIENLRHALAQLQEDKVRLEEQLEVAKKKEEGLKQAKSQLEAHVEELNSEVQQMRCHSLESSHSECDRCASVHVQWNSLRQQHEELVIRLRIMEDQCEKLSIQNAECAGKLQAEKGRCHQLAQQLSALKREHRVAIAMMDDQRNAALQLHLHYMEMLKGHLMQAEAGERLALWGQEQQEIDDLMQDALRLRAESAEAQVLCLSLTAIQLPYIPELDELFDDEDAGWALGGTSPESLHSNQIPPSQSCSTLREPSSLGDVDRLPSRGSSTTIFEGIGVHDGTLLTAPNEAQKACLEARVRRRPSSGNANTRSMVLRSRLAAAVQQFSALHPDCKKIPTFESRATQTDEECTSSGGALKSPWGPMQPMEHTSLWDPCEPTLLTATMPSFYRKPRGTHSPRISNH